MAKFCPVCDTEHPDTLEFCTHDRTPLVTLHFDRSESLVGRTIAGRFEVRSLLGRGGMGAVYRAVQLSMGRDVALKVLRQEICKDPVAIKRFFKEAQAASQLRHTNTITVFDFGQADDGTLFIAMELLHGRPLSEAISTQGQMSPGRAAGIIGQVCDALSEAHKQGIIHRDLKPDNIFLVEQEGTPDFVKVLDFGIAKVPRGKDETALTGTGQIIGTPLYMSPEHALGKSLTPASDLYALGIILYQMLSGVAPFHSTSPLALLLQHAQAPVPSLRIATQVDVPEALDALLVEIMAKAPEQRPPTARALKERLLATLGAGGARPNTVSLGPLDSYPMRSAGDSGSLPSVAAASGQRAAPNTPGGGGGAAGRSESAQKLGTLETIAAPATGPREALGVAETLGTGPQNALSAVEIASAGPQATPDVVEPAGAGPQAGPDEIEPAGTGPGQALDLPEAAAEGSTAPSPAGEVPEVTPRGAPGAAAGDPSPRRTSWVMAAVAVVAIGLAGVLLYRALGRNTNPVVVAPRPGPEAGRRRTGHAAPGAGARSTTATRPAAAGAPGGPAPPAAALTAADSEVGTDARPAQGSAAGRPRATTDAGPAAHDGGARTRDSSAAGGAEGAQDAAPPQPTAGDSCWRSALARQAQG